MPNGRYGMRTLIVGAGAVGGFLGARLTRAGHDVTLLVRPRRAAQLAGGLRLREPDGTEDVVPVRTVTASDLDGPYGLVILATKAYSLMGALADAAPAIGTETVVIPLLNGVSHLDRLVDRFGPARAYGGTVNIVTTVTESGTVVHMTPVAELAWGRVDGERDERSEAVAAALAGAGFDVAWSPDIRGLMWGKWTFLATLSATNCLLRGSVGDVLAARGGREFIQSLLDEAEAVATAAGHPPTNETLKRAHGWLFAEGSPLTSSMYRDLLKGGPTEGQHVLGDFADRARELGVPAPRFDIAALQVRVEEARRR